jgi:polyisoprenyl-phosphate glycosyltransferase
MNNVQQIKADSPRNDADATILYSLIIPVYKNQATIPRLLEILEELNDRLDHRLEVVLIVDGSPDQSHTLLHEALASCRFTAELVALSRNFGSFAAIKLGLSIARGLYFAVMSADLQEPPELVIEFFRSLEAEPIDITLGVRTERDDPALSKVSANLYWGMYRKLVQREMPTGGIDIFGCNVRVRDALVALEETNTSLVGQVLWLGFRRKQVPYRRLPRPEGKSAWTFHRKLRYMFDSIFSFTDLPLVLLTIVGSVGMAFCIVLSAVILISWALGAIPVPGYTPIILAIFFSTFCQLFGLGVIGAYLWRAYENTKRRPAFIPMIRESFGGLSQFSHQPKGDCPHLHNNAEEDRPS